MVEGSGHERKPEKVVNSGTWSASTAACAAAACTRPPAFPFQRAVRVLHQQHQQLSCLCFPLSLPLQPHVLPHLLVRCLQKCYGQAPPSSAGRCVRQLRRDGETAPAAAARRLSRSCLRCGLPRLRVTRCCADCGVLCVRCGGREDAVSVVEDG